MLCYVMKNDGHASNINRIAYSKLNHTVKKHSDWLEMRSEFTRNRLQFAWLWNMALKTAHGLKCIFPYYDWYSTCICAFGRFWKANLEEESFNRNGIFTFHHQHRLIAALKRPTPMTSLWTSLDLLYSEK